MVYKQLFSTSDLSYILYISYLLYITLKTADFKPDYSNIHGYCHKLLSEIISFKIKSVKKSNTKNASILFITRKITNLINRVLDVFFCKNISFF